MAHSTLRTTPRQAPPAAPRSGDTWLRSANPLTLADALKRCAARSHPRPSPSVGIVWRRSAASWPPTEQRPRPMQSPRRLSAIAWLNKARASARLPRATAMSPCAPSFASWCAGKCLARTRWSASSPCAGHRRWCRRSRLRRWRRYRPPAAKGLPGRG